MRIGQNSCQSQQAVISLADGKFSSVSGVPHLGLTNSHGYQNPDLQHQTTILVQSQGQQPVSNCLNTSQSYPPSSIISSDVHTPSSSVQMGTNHQMHPQQSLSTGTIESHHQHAQGLVTHANIDHGMGDHHEEGTHHMTGEYHHEPMMDPNIDHSAYHISNEQPEETGMGYLCCFRMLDIGYSCNEN